MFRVEIETGNDAFSEENIGVELAKHLTDLAKRVGNMTREDFEVMHNRGTQFAIRDTNGNRCGSASYREE